MDGIGLQSQHATWGIIFAGIMYVAGNGAWVNHLARRRQWIGWLIWLVAGIFIIIFGAFIETRLSGATTGVWQRLTSVDIDNHWIVLTLFALMSVPGAASVILRQSENWTRMALVIPAVVVFIPVGMQLSDSGGGSILAGFGLTLAVVALMLIWQFMLDREQLSNREKST